MTRFAVALGAVAAVVALAACGSAYAVSTAVTVSSPAGRSPVSPATSPAVISPGPGGQARTAVCRTSQLKIDVPWSGFGAGTVGGRIGFTNLGPSSCHLSGWPVLIGITPQRKPSAAIHKLTTMFGPNLNAAPVVTLRHGATAEAVFTAGDEPGPGVTRCPPSYRLLRVTPPGNSQSVTIPAWVAYYGHDLPACSGIWVSEVVPYSALYQR